MQDMITVTTDAISMLYQLPAARRCLQDEYRVRGIIFAIAAAPEIPLPETWMPWVIGNTSQNLTSDAVDEIAQYLMSGLRDTLDTMRQSQGLLPAHCSWQEEEGERERLQSWLTGVLQGHQQLEPVWQQAWDSAPRKAGTEAPDKRLSRCLKLFSTLARPQLALQNRSPEQASHLSANFVALARQLPAIVHDYVELADELAGQLPNQFETFVKQPDD